MSVPVTLALSQAGPCRSMYKLGPDDDNDDDDFTPADVMSIGGLSCYKYKSPPLKLFFHLKVLPYSGDLPVSACSL